MCLMFRTCEKLRSGPRYVSDVCMFGCVSSFVNVRDEERVWVVPPKFQELDV